MFRVILTIKTIVYCEVEILGFKIFLHENCVKTANDVALYFPYLFEARSYH
jgi:hypothetical protein